MRRARQKKQRGLGEKRKKTEECFGESRSRIFRMLNRKKKHREMHQYLIFLKLRMRCASVIDAEGTRRFQQGIQIDY